MTDNILNESFASECSCHICQQCCEHRPGWFMPGEAEVAAAALGMDLRAFFRSYLGVDWLEADEDEGIEEDVFILAPALKDEPTGSEYPGNPKGTCIFYQDQKCLIHGAKPRECGLAHHNQPQKTASRQHIAIGKAWVDAEPQTQIRDLLGREPTKAHYEGGSIFDLTSDGRSFLLLLESKGNHVSRIP